MNFKDYLNNNTAIDKNHQNLTEALISIPTGFSDKKLPKEKDALLINTLLDNKKIDGTLKKVVAQNSSLIKELDALYKELKKIVEDNSLFGGKSDKYLSVLQDLSRGLNSINSQIDKKYFSGF